MKVTRKGHDDEGLSFPKAHEEQTMTKQKGTFTITYVQTTRLYQHSIQRQNSTI